MKPVRYSYLPEGRIFRFVKADDKFLIEAKKVREQLAGDPLYPVGCVLVKDGYVAARAGNGFNRGSSVVHVCPRVVEECPSGTGYELCGLHDSPGHAETMLMQIVKEQGIDPRDADVYMYGHWWCCEPCWKAMIDAGVRDVYLLENAHVEFDRDRVFGETLKTSVRVVGVVGEMNEQTKQIYRTVADELVKLGCRMVVSGERRWGSICEVVVEFGENSEILVCTRGEGVVYRLGGEGDIARKIKNIIRQL